MTLKERLEKLLKWAGVGEENRTLWLQRIDALPFDRAETFIYILEKFGKEDIQFLAKNLNDKIEFARTNDRALFQRALREEAVFLLQK